MIQLPSTTILLGLIVMCAMAFAEGANDVSKVVATLVGSGLASYRRAVLFGIICTASGGLAAAVFAREVAVTLTNGLIQPSSASHVNEAFAMAALLGAMSWVTLASKMAIPVSSSHAIVGAIIILGVAAFGLENVRWDAFWSRIALPMIASPIIAIPLAIALYLVLRPINRIVSLRAWHWLSAGAASFARGLNDTPKIVALGVFFYLTGEHSWPAIPFIQLFTIVTLGMLLGSLIGGYAVTQTLAKRVTLIDHTEGLAANATTAFLMITASRLGLPVSTTHVISAALVGLGARRTFADVSWKVVRRMAMAWLITLPTSGMLAVGFYLLIRFVI